MHDERARLVVHDRLHLVQPGSVSSGSRAELIRPGAGAAGPRADPTGVPTSRAWSAEGLGTWGRARRRRPSRARRTRRAALGAPRRASSGSGWPVKNCHGVRRAPLLAHEQHRRERRGQQQRRADRQQAGGEGRGSRSPVARLPIWSWFCRQTTNRSAGDAARCPPGGRGCAARNASRCRRGRTPRSSTLAAPASGWRSRRSSPGVSPVSARAGRGGSRRSTAPSGRSRRPRAAVMSRGSLRSDSAIRVSGRPTCADRRVDLVGAAPPAGGSRACRRSACTASRRSPSTW